MEDLIALSRIAYIVYFILLVIVFALIGLVLTKVFRKNISKKKMGIWFLIILVFPFAFFKGCKSCMDHASEEYYREHTQESFVRNFLVENEAAVLLLPKFKVNSYEDKVDEDEKWVIEFEEPIDSTQLEKMDPSGTAKVKGRVLFFPIVRGYSKSIDPDFLDEEDYAKRDAEKTETSEENEPDFKYDYRNFKLELLPDGKTAVLSYSYHITYKERHRSGGGGSWHHHDD